MKRKMYIAPEIEVIEVAIEKGFAASNPLEDVVPGNKWDW